MADKAVLHKNGSVSDARHVLITGAGGGIGRELCRVFARPGRRMTLWARNADRLAAVEEECRNLGAQTRVIQRDIREYGACREQLRALMAECPVDLAILNAGVSSGTLPDGSPEPVEDACRTMEVNGVGAINMAGTLLEDMKTRSGHLVCMSSIAALYPLPSSPAYCAAKSALAVYAKAMRGELAGSPVRISIVYPGYVDSPMSRRLKGPKPLTWSAEKAALHIRDRLEAGSDTIVFPWPLALGTLLLHLLPRPLEAFFAKRFSFTINPDPESPAHGGKP